MICGLPFVLLRDHSYQFSNLCSGIVGTADMRPADMICSENADTKFGNCYVIVVL